MPSLRHALLLVAALFWCGAARAQAIHKRNLLTSLGGGAGVTTLDASVDSLDTEIVGSGALRFAFGYALGNRWSLGVHYDRLGSDDLPQGLHRVRFTTYTLEVTFRPLIGEKGALELHGAAGAGVMALTRQNERLPVRMTNGAATVGLRYVRMLVGTVGIFVGAEHTFSGDGPLTFNEQPLKDEQDQPVTANWNAQRLTAGLCVRF